MNVSESSRLCFLETKSNNKASSLETSRDYDSSVKKKPALHHINRKFFLRIGARHAVLPCLSPLSTNKTGSLIDKCKEYYNKQLETAAKIHIKLITYVGLKAPQGNNIC